MIRKSEPAGARPYSASLISRSVPSTPTRSTLTNTPLPPGIEEARTFADSTLYSVAAALPAVLTVSTDGFNPIVYSFVYNGNAREHFITASTNDVESEFSRSFYLGDHLTGYDTNGFALFQGMWLGVDGSLALVTRGV